MSDNKKSDMYYMYGNMSKNKLNQTLVMECLNGNLENVKYLLTSNELKEHADIKNDNDEAFQYACSGGNIEVIKFLLASNELKEHANIHADNDYGLFVACSEGDLELAKYLLTSPELKEHANIHANDDCYLGILCDREHLDIAQYFIFDLNIDKTKSIDKFLEDYIKNPNVEKVDGWFKLRELKHSLNEELHIEEVKNNRKHKL